MKPLTLLGICASLLLLSACEKETVETISPPKPVVDSVSYTINGQTFSSREVEKGSTFTTQSNMKITSGPNFAYLLQGDQDSILFVRDFSFKTGKSFVIMSFIKVYGNDVTEFANENNGGWLRYPKDKTAIFAPGTYKYATDFWRNNSISGIAFRMIDERADYKSYGQSDLGKPASVTQKDQVGSKFEIIKIEKRASDYLVEARFTVTVFDENKYPQKLENGYLRFSVLKIN